MLTCPVCRVHTARSLTRQRNKVGYSASVSLSLSLSVCLSVSLSLFVCLCLSLSVSLCVSLSLYLSVSLSPSLFLYLSVCLCVSLSPSLFLYLSVCLSPPSPLPLSLSLSLSSLSLSLCLSLSVSLSPSLSLSLPLSLSLLAHAAPCVTQIRAWVDTRGVGGFCTEYQTQAGSTPTETQQFAHSVFDCGSHFIISAFKNNQWMWINVQKVLEDRHVLFNFKSTKCSITNVCMCINIYIYLSV